MLKVTTGRSQINQTQEKGGEAKEGEKLSSLEAKDSRENSIVSIAGNELAPPSAVTSTQSSPKKVLVFPRQYSNALLHTSQILYHGLQNGGTWKFSRSMRAKDLSKSCSKSLISKCPLS